MADYTKNITNAVQCFGPANSTKWGSAAGYAFTMTWGTSSWGEGGILVSQYQKVISESVAPTWEQSHVVDFLRTLAAGAFTPAFSMSSQNIKNGSQWAYVFTSDTSAGSERDFASWTSGSVTDATFVCQAAASTTWSEV